MEEKSLFFRVVDVMPETDGSVENQLKKTIEKLLPLYEEYISTKETTMKTKLEMAEIELSFLKDSLDVTELDMVYKTCEIDCLYFLLDELKSKDFFDAKRAVELYADRLYRDEDRMKREKEKGIILEKVKVNIEGYKQLEVDAINYTAFMKDILVCRRNHPVKTMSEEKANNFLKSDFRTIKKIIEKANEYKQKIDNKEKEVETLKEDLTKLDVIAKDKAICSKNKSIEIAFCNKLDNILREYYYAPTTKLKKQVFDSLYETRSENMKKHSTKTDLVSEESVVKLLGDFYNGLIKLDNKEQEKGL